MAPSKTHFANRRGASCSRGASAHTASLPTTPKSHTRLLVLSLLCAVTIAQLSGCAPDPAAEALREQNTALQRQRDNDALTHSTPPLSDNSSSATSGSAGAGSANVAPGSATSLGSNPADDAQNDTDLALPVYPKAELVKQQGSSQASVQTANGINIVLMESTAPFDAIVKFYDEKMTLTVTDPVHIYRTILRHPSRVDRKQDKFRIVTLSDTQPGNGMRSVEIREDTGKTYIELMNIIGKQIPNSVAPHSAGATSSGSTPAATGQTGDPGFGLPPGQKGTSSSSTEPDPLNPTLQVPRRQ